MIVTLTGKLNDSSNISEASPLRKRELMHEQN